MRDQGRLTNWNDDKGFGFVTPEAGGWPGALIAQRLFHHKSRKVTFQVTFWFIVSLHLAAVAALAFRIPRVFFGT